MFIAYNLRRLMNIIDKNDLKKFLQELAFTFFKILAFLNAIISKITPRSYKLVSLVISFQKASQLPRKKFIFG